MPSQGELNLMYINLKKNKLGGFSDGQYWSSSQNDNNTAWSQKFNDGEQISAYAFGQQGGGSKSNTYSVRACRQF